MHKILIVEDELEVIKVLEEFFSLKGFETRRAFNGMEALDIVNAGTEIDLIILDIKMPKMKGVEFLVESKIIKAKVPVIILSGSVNIRRYYSVLKGLGYDPDDIVYKPIDLHILFEMVQERIPSAKQANS